MPRLKPRSCINHSFTSDHVTIRAAHARTRSSLHARTNRIDPFSHTGDDLVACNRAFAHKDDRDYSCFSPVTPLPRCSPFCQLFSYVRPYPLKEVVCIRTLYYNYESGFKNGTCDDAIFAIPIVYTFC
jgi:hypothetical protein